MQNNSQIDMNSYSVDIKSLVAALQLYKMNNEVNMVNELVDTVKALQNDITNISNQLENLQQNQNNVVQNKDLKEIVSNYSNDILLTVKQAKTDLQDTKNNIANKAAEIVSDVSKFGKKGLSKIKDFFSFQKPIKAIQNKVNSVSTNCTQAINSIDEFSKRLSKSKNQLKAAGNTLVGKDIFKPSPQHYSNEENFKLLKSPFININFICQHINVAAQNKVGDKFFYSMISKSELSVIKELLAKDKVQVEYVPSADCKDKYIVRVKRDKKEQLLAAMENKQNKSVAKRL